MLGAGGEEGLREEIWMSQPPGSSGPSPHPDFTSVTLHHHQSRGPSFSFQTMPTSCPPQSLTSDSLHIYFHLANSLHRERPSLHISSEDFPCLIILFLTTLDPSWKNHFAVVFFSPVNTVNTRTGIIYIFPNFFGSQGPRTTPGT